MNYHFDSFSLNESGKKERNRDEEKETGTIERSDQERENISSQKKSNFVT